MSQEELILDLPWNIIDAGKGLSLDLGGSQLQVIFLHKDNWVEPSNRTANSVGHLHLVTFAQEQFDEALSHVKKHGHIIRPSPEETVRICTVNVTVAQKAKLTSELNVEITNMKETESFAKSSSYLMKTIPRKEALVDLYRPAYDKVINQANKYFDALEKMKEVSASIGKSSSRPEIKESRVYTDNLDKPLAEEHDMFPCVVFLCGKICKCLLIKEDGSFTVQEGSKIAETMFLGVGSLLTGGKTYGDLLELATKGNSLNVGISNIALSEGIDKEEESMYTAFTDETLDEEMAFFFGQAVGKTMDDFQKEDMVKSVLDVVLQEMVHVSHYLCKTNKVKNIFFCGGFTGQPLVRQLLSREWLERDIVFSLFGGKKPTEIAFHFLKHGSYLGAMGAYLK